MGDCEIKEATHAPRPLTLILCPGGGEETPGRFIAPMCVRWFAVGTPCGRKVGRGVLTPPPDVQNATNRPSGGLGTARPTIWFWLRWFENTAR